MIDVQRVTRVWQRNAEVLNTIARPRTEEDYADLIALIEHLTDAVDDLERNPYSALLEIAVTYADEWEASHPSFEDTSTPRDVLAFLMEQHGATQKDLERAGVAAQPVISKVLSGEREISKAVAKRLAAHFGVNSGVFL